MTGTGSSATRPQGGRVGTARLAARLVTVGLLTASLNAAFALSPQQSVAAVSASAKLNRLEVRLANVSRSLRPLVTTTRKISPWLGCITEVGVDQAGDFDSAQGYQYDARDGTVPGWSSALALHSATALAPQYTLLDFSSDDACESRLAPQENAAPPPPVAAVTRAPRAFRKLSRRAKVKVLGGMVLRLDRRLTRAEKAVGRFDEWESCASWLPVTEYGDAGGTFGYPQGGGGEGDQTYRPAITVDRSAWDDPDYELLVFKGADRPFTSVECDDGPGEGTDIAPRGGERGRGHLERPAALTSRAASVADAIEDLTKAADDLEEDVQDLAEPVQDFELFDGCMYTIGASSTGDAEVGYEYTEGGRESRRDALAFDVGLQAPTYNLMVFPGEEPPQIECDEDAGGQDTDE